MRSARYWVFAWVAALAVTVTSVPGFGDTGGSLGRILSVRVDPGYLYSDFPGVGGPDAIARRLVEEIKSTGANTIFVYAYNPVYGAYYSTNYRDTVVEPGLGKQDIFRAIVKRGRAAGLNVVATFPVNVFKNVWETHHDWRSKTKNGDDYKPFAEVYPLCAWHPEFQTWYRGLIRDFLKRHPGVAGVEAHEGSVDFQWKAEADFNPVANRGFSGRFPASELGDSKWKRFRADGLTRLISILSEEAHRARKQAFVVQTWPMTADGQFMDAQTVRDESGFDFEALMQGERRTRPDYVMAELNWQQWRAEHDDEVFSPEWTLSAGRQFVSESAGKVTPLVHVELSKFSGSKTTVEPSLQQFRDALVSAAQTGAGVDVYDYHQLKTRGALNIVREIYLSQH